MALRVYLEEGQKLVLAASLDWPGWCRFSRLKDQALESLRRYLRRFRAIVGVSIGDEESDVIGAFPGCATTDFGAPRVIGAWDEVISSQPGRRA
jgi:hypothetical protein